MHSKGDAVPKYSDYGVVARNSCDCTNMASSGQRNQVSPFLCNCEKWAFSPPAPWQKFSMPNERRSAFMTQFYPNMYRLFIGRPASA